MADHHVTTPPPHAVAGREGEADAKRILGQYREMMKGWGI